MEDVTVELGEYNDCMWLRTVAAGQSGVAVVWAEGVTVGYGVHRSNGYRGYDRWLRVRWRRAIAVR